MPPPLTAKIKQVSATQPRQTMRGHTRSVTGVVHLQDGRRIITCSYDGSLRLWNLESGVQIGDYWCDDGDEAYVWSIALSPNGKTLASGGGGKIRLWDVETKKLGARWTGHTRSVKSLCWSADGERVVSGSDDRMIRIWDVKSGDIILGPIESGYLWVSAVIYSPDTTKIAIGGGYMSGLTIWDAKTCEVLSTIKTNNQVGSIAWTSDQKKLIFADRDRIRILDTTTWQQIAVLKGHTDFLYTLSLFQNDRLLASASYDSTARLWNLDTNLPVGPPIQHEGPVCCAAISADGKLLVTGCYDSNAYVWDIYTTLKDAGLEELLSIPDDSGSPDGLKQNVTTRKSLVDTEAMRRPAKHEYTYRLPPRFFDDTQDSVQSGVQIGNDWRDDGKEGVWSIALSPNGKTVASGSRDGTIRLWDVETKKVVARWTGHTDAAGLCWSADGERVVSGANDGTIRVWDVESGDTVLGPIETGHRHVSPIIYSPDTTKIATGGLDETALKIWNAKTGNLLSTINLDSVFFSLAWTSDQKKLITGSYASIRIFDTATWQQIAILDGHTDIVFSLSLFQNNRLLASGSYDNTVRLWNLDTYLQIGPPIQHGGTVFCAAISADGKLLVTGCRDNNAYVWDIHTTLKDACLEDFLFIPDVSPDGLKQKVTTRKSLMDTDATRRLAKHEYAYRLPPRFFDDARDSVQTSDAHSHSSGPRLPRSSASPPHAHFNQKFSLFHRSCNTNQSMELQQSLPRPVEVAAVQDKRALYVAPRPEHVSDIAKRIRNPTWRTRCILFICCVSIPQDANDAQDTNHHQENNNAPGSRVAGH